MDLRFSFTVPNTAVFTLGPQEGTFPWGLALDAEPTLISPAMDGFGPRYTPSYPTAEGKCFIK